jgi:hypothetical protein
MTPTQQLAELKLGGSLEQWVTDRRTRGDSWRTIARDLHAETNIAVSDETLRQWFPTEVPS